MDRTLHSQTFTDYQPNDSLFDSHYTRVTQPQENQDNWFIQQRTFSRSVLAAWGLPLGELPYSADNQQTLRSLVELIGFRQKDLQYRSKVKQDIAAINFQKQKYRSFMQQAQRNLQQCMRKLGRSENETSDLKNKSKKNEVQTKKQKDEDRKMIAMLKAKNEQIMHEIKKKQQQLNRIKQQMKKSIGQKSLVHAKNSFQIFQILSPLKREKSQKGDEVKYNFLIQRNERQMNHLVGENGILREKLFQIRQKLLDFNQWVDKQLFGESDVDQFKRKSKFPLNHNLVFKKESLVDQLAILMETAKDGILQLRDFYRGNNVISQKKTRSSELLPNREQLDDKFKKKPPRHEVLKTDRSKPDLNKESKQKQTPMIQKVESNTITESYYPSTKKQIQKNEPQKQQKSQKNINKNFKLFDTKSPKNSIIKTQQIDIPFQNELISDVVQNHDNSLISHIEVSKIGKNKFDKWDILYQQDDD